MRFFAATTFILAVTAAPLASDSIKASGNTQLEARVLDPITLAVITGAVGGASGWATREALTGLKSIIQDSSTWDAAREAFTKDAVAKMAQNYKADPSFKGAVCYNEGYLYNDPNKRSDITKLELKSGSLKTDYDCFYMKSGGEFKQNGDGGFINLAVDTNNGACGFSSPLGLMTCG